MENDILGLMIKSVTDDIVYGYGYNSEEFRKKSINLKNMVNDLIEDCYLNRYAYEDVEKDCPASSPNNIRYVKCVCCGDVKPTSEFVMYGGINTKNQGVCRECNNIIQGESDEIEKQEKSFCNYNDYFNDNECIIFND